MIKKDKKTILRHNAYIVTRAIRTINEVWPKFISRSVINVILKTSKPLVSLYLSSLILNELSGKRDVKLIVAYVIVIVTSVFFLSILEAFITQKLEVEGLYNYSNLEILYAKKYIKMDYQNVEDSKTNQMLANIRAASNGNGLGLLSLSKITPDVIGGFASIVASIVLLAGIFKTSGEYTRNAITSPIALIVLFVLMVIGIASPLFIRRLQKEAMDTLQRENPKANTLFFYYDDYKNLENAAKDVRIYNQSKTILDIFEKRLNLKMWFWFFRRFSSTEGISGALGGFVAGSVYLFIGLRALYGMYPIGSVVQYIGAITTLTNQLSSMTAAIGRLTNNIPYMQKIFDYLDLSSHCSISKKDVDLNNICIEFKNVSFRYPDSDRYALRNINICFKKGHRLAVVGMNGSGKTTMVKLLCQLYEPTEGVILLNGEDIRMYNHIEYIELFSVIFQDFKLFSLALGENISISKTYDMNRVKDALITAGFSDRLVSLEKGLDTMLGNDCDKEGVSLSGGEEQKLAIARSIYRDSPFMVFDEPTAALDPISEYEIYTKLNEIIGDKTAIFISHRLSSCRFCDDIAVFHEGELIQYGNHETLVTQKEGRYYEMWNAQAQYYVD